MRKTWSIKNEMSNTCENQRKQINNLIYQIENLNCNYIIQKMVMVRGPEQNVPAIIQL